MASETLERLRVEIIQVANRTSQLAHERAAELDQIASSLVRYPWARGDAFDSVADEALGALQAHGLYCDFSREEFLARLREAYC